VLNFASAPLSRGEDGNNIHLGVEEFKNIVGKSTATRLLINKSVPDFDLETIFRDLAMLDYDCARTRQTFSGRRTTSNRHNRHRTSHTSSQEGGFAKSASPLINRTMNQAKPPLVQGQKVWCTRCGEYVNIVRVATAAKIVDTDRRTIYNYIKKSKVQVFKVAGGTLRVCSQCLLRDEE